MKCPEHELAMLNKKPSILSCYIFDVIVSIGIWFQICFLLDFPPVLIDNVFILRSVVCGHKQCQSTWTATGLWGSDLLSQSLPSSPSNIFDINLSSSKLRPISCSHSDVIWESKMFPLLFNIILYNSKVLSFSFHSSIQNHPNLLFPGWVWLPRPLILFVHPQWLPGCSDQKWQFQSSWWKKFGLL